MFLGGEGGQAHSRHEIKPVSCSELQVRRRWGLGLLSLPGAEGGSREVERGTAHVGCRIKQSPQLSRRIQRWGHPDLGPSPDPPPTTALLCHPCPWGWRSFQGNCYFFSNSQLNWHDSVTACEEVEAQLVVIESAEEQVRLSGDPHLAWGVHLTTGPLGRR